MLPKQIVLIIWEYVLIKNRLLQDRRDGVRILFHENGLLSDPFFLSQNISNIRANDVYSGVTSSPARYPEFMAHANEENSGPYSSPIQLLARSPVT